MKLGLNVGSGQRKFSTCQEVTWTNIDVLSRDGEAPDLICDGAHLPHCADTVDYFVLSQVYEHFGCGEAEGLLKEAYRVLRPGGSLIISVPNMMALAKRWIAGEISEYIFMVNTYGAYRGEESDRHRWGTTPESLTIALLAAAPWTGISSYIGTPVPGMSVALDWWITALEARK